jgi:hypothetical protein
MRKLNHTPGPWRVVPHSHGINCVRDDGSEQITGVPHSSVWKEDAWSCDNATEESKANDLLMSKAPEMLGLLISIYENGIRNEALLRQVIEKATDLNIDEVLKRY